MSLLYKTRWRVTSPTEVRYFKSFLFAAEHYAELTYLRSSFAPSPPARLEKVRQPRFLTRFWSGEF